MGASRKGTKYKLVPLTRGLVTAVSPEDYDAVMRHRWYANIRTDGRVVVVSDGVGRKSLALASFILGVTPPTIVDHWNGNSLDNRRVNLRAGTQAQNMYNKPKVWRNGRKPSTKYKGVFPVSRTTHNTENPYFARIKVAGKNTYLGCFSTEEDAAKAYDAAGRKLVGKFFKPNFPKSHEVPPALPVEIAQQEAEDTTGSYAQLRFSNNTYVGVCSSRDKWRWRIMVCRQEVCRGGFLTAREAAVARDAYIRKHGLPHVLNFPKETL